MKRLYFLFVMMALTCIGAVAQSTFYLRGGMNDWLNGGLQEAWQFKLVSGDDYILENVEIASGLEFKVADADWGSINYGGATNMEADKDYTLQANGSNCKLAVNFKGNVKFNLATHVIRFEGEAEVPVVDPDAWKSWYVNFKGDFNKWSSDEGVQADAEGIATSKTYTANGGFKVCVWDGIKDVWHSSGSQVTLNQWISIPDNNDNNMTFPANMIGQEVVFKFDVINNKLMVVGEEPVAAPETLFVYSTMSGFAPVEMTKTETGFIAEGVVIPTQVISDDTGWFKFTTVAEPQSMDHFYGSEKSNQWTAVDTEYPIIPGSSSNWEIFPGTYDIIVTVADDASMTFKYMKQATPVVDMITIYWDNAEGWKDVTCSPMDENYLELTDDDVPMMPCFQPEEAAEFTGKVNPENLYMAQIPANTVKLYIMGSEESQMWMNFNGSGITAPVADQMVYGVNGVIGHISEVITVKEPEVETVKVFIAGNTTEPNKSNIRKGIAGTDAEGFTIQITGNTEKTLDDSNKFTIDGKSYTGMKNSIGQTITVTLPEGYVGKSVTIYSTINDAADSYWSEVDGIAYTADDQTNATHKGSGEDYDTNTFPLSGKNTFTFNNKGKQMIFVLAVEMAKASVNPEPVVPEALYLRGNVDAENNMLEKDGMVYSGKVTVKAAPGEMYGTVRVYTANDDNAKNYGGVTDAVNCVAVSGKIIELAEDGVDISALPGEYNVKVEWADDIKTIVFNKVEAEGYTLYFDNTVAKWAEPWIGWQSEEGGDFYAMTRNAAASPEGYELWSATVPTNTMMIQMWDMADETEENLMEPTEEIVDNGVYGPTGFICTLDQLVKPEPAPEALYLRGNVDAENNMLTKDGIVYSGNVTIVAAPGEMYGTVRVYTANDDNAKNYGGVTDAVNCVAVSGKVIELAETGVAISALPGDYNVSVEWADDIKTIVFNKVEVKGFTVYFDNTTAKWAEPWLGWVDDAEKSNYFAMTRNAAASPEGYELWSAVIPANTVMIQMWDMLDETDENFMEPTEEVVENGVYGPAGFICTLDELGKTEPEPTETLLFKWYNPEGLADYTAEAGTIVAKVDEQRLNYANTALGKEYKTICLSGKKGDTSTAYMEVTFTEPLKEGDVISMTAFRNKNATGKGASAYLLFDNGASVVIGGSDGLGFVNLNADGETPDATEPNTLTYTVTAAQAGATSMTMTRDKSSTNLFITNLTISGERETPQPAFEVPETLYLLGLSDAIEMTRNGNTFTLENVEVPTWFGMCPIMYFQDVPTEGAADARIFGPKPEETEDGTATCQSGVAFDLVEAENADVATTFTTPYAANYNFSVTFEDGKISATVTEVEPAKIVIYWDNTVAKWAKPGVVVDIYYLWGSGRNPIEMTPVEGKANLFMAEVPDNLPFTYFIDLSQDPESEDFDPEVSVYEYDESPIANMVYSNYKTPVDISHWSAVISIEAEAAEAVYFDLRGVRVEKPAAGNLYIRVEDGKASKVRF